MKTILIYLIGLMPLFTMAQNKTVELYDLIKTYSMGLDGTGKFSNLNTFTDKNGEVNVVIDGKSLLPDENLLIEKITWVSILDAAKRRYSIQAMGYLPDEKASILASLFGNKLSEFTLIKKCTDSSNSQLRKEIYKVHISPTNPFWMIIETSAMYGPYMPILDVKCFANDEEAGRVCNE